MLSKEKLSYLIAGVFFVLLPVFGYADSLVNINIAPSSELQKLDRIGSVLAQNIIDYRNTNGDFGTIDEIVEVSRIGPATFEKIKDYITVGSTESGDDDDSGGDDDTGDDDDTTSVDDPGDGDTGEEDTSNDEDQDDTSSSSGGGTSNHFVLGGEILTVEASSNKKYAIAHTPVVFTGEAYYGDRESVTAQRIWNFGNGDTDIGKQVTYSFDHEGDYVVTFSAKTYEEEVFTSLNIEIINSEDIVISSVVEGSGGYIEIENKSSRRHELSKWRIVSGGTYFLVAPHTYIGAGSKMRFTAKTLNFNPIKEATSLQYPDGVTANVYTWNRPSYSAYSVKYTDKTEDVSSSQSSDNAENDDVFSTSTVAGVAGVGATPPSDNFMIWLILLVGLITIGSITILLLRRPNTTLGGENELTEEDFTIVE